MICDIYIYIYIHVPMQMYAKYSYTILVMEVYGFCDRICRSQKGHNFILLAGDVTLKRILPSPLKACVSDFSAHGVTTIVFTRAPPAAAQVRGRLAAVGARPGPCAGFGTVMAMATSYKWLFLWDYTFYKWGYKYTYN